MMTVMTVMDVRQADILNGVAVMMFNWSSWYR
jgi:hypothetical protein